MTNQSEIKIQFAFDNERHFTVWMPLRFYSSFFFARKNKRSEKKIPMITFTFTHYAGHYREREERFVVHREERSKETVTLSTF